MKDYLELLGVVFRSLRLVMNERLSPREVLEKAHLQNRRPTAEERRFLRFALYGAIRRDLAFEWELAAVLKKPGKTNPRVMTALKLALFLIRESGMENAVVTDLTLKMLKSEGLGWACGLANSTLRKLAVKTPTPPPPDENAALHLQAVYGFPQWLGAKLIEEKGFEYTRGLAEFFLKIPRIAIRVNTLKTNATELKQTLAKEEVNAESSGILPDSALVLPHDVDFTGLKSFTHGLWSVQNEASQAVSFLLAPQPGEKILDMCAAPGSKTTHIHELSEGRAKICATDINNARLVMLEKSMKRLGIKSGIEIKHIDGLNFKNHDSFDAVLVDAPCTGIGTWAHNPEGRLFRSAEDIIKLASTQKELLKKAARFVKPGGRIVYSVCTITKEETTEQAKWFIEDSKHGLFEKQMPQNFPGGLNNLISKNFEFLSEPERDEIDGFYAVVLKKFA